MKSEYGIESKSNTMKKSILIGANIIMFIILIIIYTIIAYGSGYASNSNYNTSAWILYGVFFAIHLLANGVVLYKFKLHDKWIIISSYLIILFLYSFLIWAYRPVG